MKTNLEILMNNKELENRVRENNLTIQELLKKRINQGKPITFAPTEIISALSK